MAHIFQDKLKHRFIIQATNGKRISISARQEAYDLALDLLETHERYIQNVEIPTLADRLRAKTTIENRD